MALQADVRYVQYSVDGTAARKVQRQVVQQETAPVCKRRKTERKVIAVDPVALAGIVLSAVVLVAMVVGLVQYQQNVRLSRQMSEYVQQLEQENVQLEQIYRDGYDLDEIRDIAVEAGMVPEDTVEKVVFSVEEPEQEQVQMSFWDTVTTFLAGIFA